MSFPTQPDRSSIHSWSLLKQLLKDNARVSEEPFTLSSGSVTDVYLDVPAAICTGTRANTVAVTILSWLEANGIPPNTISAFGGPSFGAAPIAISISSLALFAGGFMFKWFSVRSEPKNHGVRKLIDGAELGPKDRVILVDDVLNSGDSLRRAYEAINATGAEVVAVVPVVDRSGKGARLFRDELRVPYLPLFLYFDLDLQPL